LKDLGAKLGLPDLGEVASVLKNLPDEPRLKLVRLIIKDMERVKGTPEDLQAFLALVRVIGEVDMARLNAIRDITKNLAKLVGALPKDLLKDLPVADMVGEFRRQLAGGG